ncbi:MAG: hypothetical protein AAGM22_27570, partial [Acidobacteriota bacterium]
DRMRFNIRGINRGSSSISWALAIQSLELADRTGRRYSIVQVGPGGTLAPGLAGDLFFESQGPRNQARHFELSLSGDSLPAQSHSLVLPDYPKHYSQLESEAIASFTLAAGEHEIRSTQDGLRAKLLGIDQLGNGRLRWHLELYNEQREAIEVGYDPRTTKLLMGGNIYRLAATDEGLPGEPKLRRLKAGETWKLWLEFAGRFVGDEAFDLLVGSPVPSQFRYRAMAARLDEVASPSPPSP